MIPSGWKSTIPEELHVDFQRQVEERVSSELMAALLEDTDRVDENAMEAELLNKYIEYYQVQYLSKEWPPKVGVALGVRAGEILKTHSDHWICSHCRERNFNSFDTCRKCSETKSESQHSIAPPIVESSNKVVETTVSDIWFCKECSGRNLLNNLVCSKCGLHQDVYKRDSWPLIADVPDSEIRRKIRLELFQLLLEEFQVDDPFCSIEISHSEYTEAVDRLKKQLLRKHLGKEELVI